MIAVKYQKRPLISFVSDPEVSVRPAVEPRLHKRTIFNIEAGGETVRSIISPIYAKTVIAPPMMASQVLKDSEGTAGKKQIQKLPYGKKQ